VGFEKLLVIGLLAMFLLGPERLPDYAARLGRLVRTGRRMLDDANQRMRDELGEDFDPEEWRKLDPRQYDPRRIIRDALLEPDPDDTTPDEESPEPEQPEPRRATARAAGTGETVFDSEAT
jgi:sec-independent protein translocase protein TatB